MSEQSSIRAKTDRALSHLLPPLESPDIFKKVYKGKKVKEAKSNHDRPVANNRSAKQHTIATQSDPLLNALRHTVKHSKASNRNRRPDRPSHNRNFRKSTVYTKGTGLSPTSKAVGLVTQAKEAFIKIDKASNGIKTAKHLMEAACYIARNGKNEIYDSFGEAVDFEDMKTKVEEWTMGDSPLADGETSKYAEARRLILSCPKGSDPNLVLESAKQFAKEMLTENGYDFIMALHCKDEEHPNEPDHPHVHILLKARNDDGLRFNPRKDDLKFMRERFAAIAKARGLNINATPRAVRGVSARSKPIERFHHERRSQEKANQTQAQKWAIDRKKKQQTVANHPYRTSRDKEVMEAVRAGKPLTEHDALIKAKKTRNEIIKNATHAVSELNKIVDPAAQTLSKHLSKTINDLPEVKSDQQRRVDEIRAFIAEKQRRRQAQRSTTQEVQETAKTAAPKKKEQSQAQRWAIERKKRNLER